MSRHVFLDSKRHLVRLGDTGGFPREGGFTPCRRRFSGRSEAESLAICARLEITDRRVNVVFGVYPSVGVPCY